MDGLPVILRLAGKRVVVIGGGPVAVRRAGAMIAAGAQVTVIAPQVDERLPPMDVTIHRRFYQDGDLAGATLVVIATDDAAVNEKVAHDAQAEGVLVNRTDDAGQSDVLIPARGERGPVTLAVHTGNISSAAAAMIRDELLVALRPQWVTLLQTIDPYRAIIQQRVTDPAERQRRLRELASSHAMDVLQRGGVEALTQHCEQLAGATRA